MKKNSVVAVLITLLLTLLLSSCSSNANDAWSNQYPVASETALLTAPAPIPVKVTAPEAIEPFAETAILLEFNPEDKDKIVAPRILVAAVSTSRDVSLTGLETTILSSIGPATTQPAEEKKDFVGPWKWSRSSLATPNALPPLVVPPSGQVPLKIRINNPIPFDTGILISADTGPETTTAERTWSGVGTAGFPTTNNTELYKTANDALPPDAKELTLTAKPVSGWGDSLETWVPSPYGKKVEGPTPSLNETLTKMGVAAVDKAQESVSAPGLPAVDASKCKTPNGGTCIVSTTLTAPSTASIKFNRVYISFIGRKEGEVDLKPEGWSAKATVDGVEVPTEPEPEIPLSYTVSNVDVPAGQKKVVTWTVKIPPNPYKELRAYFGLETFTGWKGYLPTGIFANGVDGSAGTYLTVPGNVTFEEYRDWKATLPQ